jgi:hypothetical protein
MPRGGENVSNIFARHARFLKIVFETGIREAFSPLTVVGPPDFCAFPRARLVITKKAGQTLSRPTGSAPEAERNQRLSR